MPSSNIFRDLSVHLDGQTEGQTDMAISTRLVVLIKNIYNLWGRKGFILPFTYFPTNLVYPFTLRVTGITKKNAIVEYLDYQIPDTQTDMARSTDLVILI